MSSFNRSEVVNLSSGQEIINILMELKALFEIQDPNRHVDMLISAIPDALQQIKEKMEKYEEEKKEIITTNVVANEQSGRGIEQLRIKNKSWRSRTKS